MIIVSVHETKTNLCKRLAAVGRGEEVIINGGDKVVAKTRAANDAPVEKQPRGKRRLGHYEGMFENPDSFGVPASGNHRPQSALIAAASAPSLGLARPAICRSPSMTIGEATVGVCRQAPAAGRGR